ncbi:MAG: M10 family metallopeptidase C-terminal domain-containing protein [Paracoccaceae bacterium]|nr:M10 family metallopeptidase C-terminal domain-containing protein [Paracoccaceae bacterium]
MLINQNLSVSVGSSVADRGDLNSEQSNTNFSSTNPSGSGIQDEMDKIDRPGDITAFSETRTEVSVAVSYDEGLIGPGPTVKKIPSVEFEHIGGCGCPGCGGMRTEDAILREMVTGNDANTGLSGGALSAPSQLSDLADFLTTGFWNNFGRAPGEFNMTGSGINAKSGVLHYNVTGFSNAGRAGTDTNGLSSARADLVRDVMDVFGEVLGISFQETTSSSVNVTDIFFKDTDARSAYANSAGSSGNFQYSWINVSQDWSGSTSTYNDYTLQTIFHEVGHALGLGHQGVYNGSGSYATDADFENDSWQATMMSYFSQNENTSIPASFSFLQTPMAVDWIALQDMYGDQSFGGTNFGVGNAFLGDTVYGFNTNISSNTSNIWAEFATYADKTASTIVDAGGIDTLDFSGYSATQLINLTPTNQFDTAPSISDIGGRIGNLTLAEGTIIENAIGGSGADTFFGNNADNTFTGNAGNDLFYDSLGADRYFGGSGTDTVDFQDIFESFSFNISGAFLQVINAATDFVENTVEFLKFGNQTLSFQSIVDGLGTNSAPTANNDTYATDEQTVLTGGNLLANDTDTEDGALVVSTVNGGAANVGAQISLASGALLSVNSDGTFEYDPNGAFDWLAEGQVGTDAFSYTASDGSAVSNQATVSISLSGIDDTPAATAIGQSGVATVSQSGPNEWHTVTFGAVISDAVVVMGPATNLDTAPLSTRVRNVSDTGFQFQIDEWDYLDGVHGLENIGWLAVSEGSHTLSSGEKILASTASVGDGFSNVSFGETLTDAVVLAEVTSVNESDAVVTRIRGVNDTGFQTRIQEQEAGNSHVDETVSWIAIESGLNSAFEAFQTPNEVRHLVSSYEFTNDFGATPVLLADMQSNDGGDTATTRLAALDSGGVSLFVEEEQSANVETNHATETVGIAAFAGGLLYANEQPDAGLILQDDTATVSESNVLSLDVLSNDANKGGGALVLTQIEGVDVSVGDSVTLASGARVTLNADQTVTYDQNSSFDALNTGQSATDQFVYTVSNGESATSAATVTVTILGADDPTPAGDVIGQSGVVSVSQAGPGQWHSISFDAAIENAVVVLGPATSNDSAQLTTRVRSVTETGFEFQIDEWNYLDGVHGVESIGWLAISEGSHTLGSGQTVVASTASIDTRFSTLSFGETLDDAIVFAEVSTVNESDAVTTRIKSVSEQGFEVKIQEEEAGDAHGSETVSWIAIESGLTDGLEAVRASNLFGNDGAGFEFENAFAATPVLIADMQSTFGSDPATIRLSSLDANDVSMFVEEEQSANDEVRHIEEVAGYIALDSGLIYEDTFIF